MLFACPIESTAVYISAAFASNINSPDTSSSTNSIRSTSRTRILIVLVVLVVLVVSGELILEAKAADIYTAVLVLVVLVIIILVVLRC